MNTPSASSPPPDDYFATTRWTVVLQAGRKSSPHSDRALAELCESYWYPLYCYVRRRVSSREDAEDLVQAYFERFIGRNHLEGLSADRGRFRAFLLASLKHFLANEWDKAGRQKRGGGVQPLSLDWQDAETRFQQEPPDPAANPEQVFDRQWALAVLERVIQRLRDECVADGKANLFEQTKGYLMVGEEAIPYAEAATALGIDAGAVRVTVHRLRKRYRSLLRDEIAQTLTDPDQVPDELQSLQAALSR
jgi:RNA polymerase sigma-70 factor (ECF subfamily)